MSMDGAEAWSNAIVGLAVSVVAVWCLRAAGVWATVPAWEVSALFFGLSLARARVLRWWFRGLDA